MLPFSVFITLTVKIKGWDGRLRRKVLEPSCNGDMTQNICSNGTGRNSVSKQTKRLIGLKNDIFPPKVPVSSVPDSLLSLHFPFLYITVTAKERK